MIRLCVEKDKDGRYMGFVCSGHAGYGEYGQDIVCAGVSALVLTIANSLEAYTPDRIRTETGEEDGRIACRLEAPASEKAALLFDTLVLGCQSILSTYGTEYIEVTFREV